MGEDRILTQALGLQRTEKTLHRCVVPAIAIATRRGCHAMAPLHTGHHDPSDSLVPPLVFYANTLLSMRRSPTASSSAYPCPTNDFTRIQIFDRGQKQPAFVRRNVEDQVSEAGYLQASIER